jgi:capsid portal protein
VADSDDIEELRSLLKELNTHEELSVKISSVSKVLKMLVEDQDKQGNVYAEIQQNKAAHL